MILSKSGHARLEPVTTPDAKSVQMVVLLGPEQGAPRFAMRRFVLAAGGHTPRHQHDFEHEVYIIRGRGTVWTSSLGETCVGAGDALFIPANEPHQFLNHSPLTLEFLCMVPVGCGCQTSIPVTPSRH